MIYKLPLKKDGFSQLMSCPHHPVSVVHKQVRAGSKLKQCYQEPSSSHIPLCRLSLCSNNCQKVSTEKQFR